MENKHINLVLCTDNNFVKPSCTAITSIIENNKNYFYDIYIITEGLSKYNTLLINKIALNFNYCSNIRIIEFNKQILSSCPIRKNDHVSIATYFRILLPSILPSSINKILYIDGDILCISEISDLYNLDLSNYSCAAVRDCRNNDKEFFQRLDYKEEFGYFNAGVMLINLKFWRDNDIQNKTLKYIIENPTKCIRHDQDALNKTLSGTVLFTDFKYNLLQKFFFYDRDEIFIDSSYFKDIDKAIRNPCLIHYCTEYKPWNIECIHPYKKLYKKYYRIAFFKFPKSYFKEKGIKRLKWVVKFLLHKLKIKRYIIFQKSIIE